MLDKKITRKEFVKMLASLAGLTLISSKLGFFDKLARKKEEDSSSYGNSVYGG